MNPEMIKLLAILIGGAVIVIIGVIVHKKKLEGKRAESKNFNAGGFHEDSRFSPHDNPEEEKAKNYILENKDHYPRESLRTALVKSGNDEKRVDDWLDKYYES